jgi:hypothetical protein
MEELWHRNRIDYNENQSRVDNAAFKGMVYACFTKKGDNYDQIKNKIKSSNRNVNENFIETFNNNSFRPK